MKKLLFLLLPLFFAAGIKAQTIAGYVKDEQGKTLSGASVALKKATDSAVVKLAVSNATGQYVFNGIPSGRYFVTVSFVGYQPKAAGTFEWSGSGDVNVPDLTIAKASGNLKEVVVTTRKPMIEVRADKTILNVEGSVNAVGQDALELLRKSPGVSVDKDDNLSISGKNGVQVYIDGRPTPLSGKDLSDYLKTIQSSSVESIEIITNPSAKYDAAGNAGIINIKLKKNKSFGTNGSVNAGYNIGITPKYTAGLSLNHRNGNINLFGNYTYNRGNTESNMVLYRTLLDSSFNQKGNVDYRNNSHGFKAGIDYTINKKSSVGVMVNGNLADININNKSHTEIGYIPTNTPVRFLVADNTSTSSRDNVNGNINYRYTDSTGHEWTMDGDYGMYRIKSDQLQPNVYYKAGTNDFISSRIYNMIAPNNIDIYSFKTDYEQNFKKGRLGLGGKVSYVTSDNDFQRYDVISNGKTLDTLRSNLFNYKENINAGYINYNRSFKGFMIQAGLRVENTHATGQSTGFKQNSSGYIAYDSTFTRDYTDFFPSAAITFNKKPTSQLSFTYSRRIDRPSYQDLNPFEFKLDDYTFQKGNTNLRPQYTNSFGVTHMYKYKLTTTLNYSHVSDVYSQLVDTLDFKAFLTKKNLATQDIVSINISYPFMYKWYSVFANVNANYSHFKADFGSGRKVDVDAYAATVYAQQTFRLNKKGLMAEMTGFYSTPAIWQGTFVGKRAIWSLDAGLQKPVLKGKGTIKASVSDIFKTLKWVAVSEFTGQYLRASGNSETRQFKLNFTYRFGNSQVKAARQRKTGQEEETKRVSQGGGGIGN